MLHKIIDIQQSLRKDEVWRNVDFSALLDERLTLPRPDMRCDYTLRCNIPNLETERIVIENGFCHEEVRTTADGVVIGGLRKAMEQRPELVMPHMAEKDYESPYAQLNREGYSDGAFVYVPRGVTTQVPIQLLSIHTADQPLMLQVRNVVVCDDDSHLRLICCDDSVNQQRSFANNVTHILAGRGAYVEQYKLQNLNDMSGLLNHTYTTMQEGSTLRSVAVTLNGGHIRNHSEIRMTGEHCDTGAHGLYLNDHEQRVDNYLFVEHACPRCKSEELFKGILDDSAHATFNGHVLVKEGAEKTEAYQSNKNILLTDKALIYTKPFLEIYNDDVKCSHGSTIGQLDDEAMFYIRSRGISEKSARTLLLYAFCDEVIQKIELPQLRERLSDMVKKRLHGELTVCSDCALHCNNPCGCSNTEFHIDTSLLP